MTHICVNKLTIFSSDNGLLPGRRQAIIWTNTGILLIGPLGTNFSEILIEIQIFSFKKMGLNVSSAKWRPFCLGLNVLISDLLMACQLASYLWEVHVIVYIVATTFHTCSWFVGVRSNWGNLKPFCSHGFTLIETCINNYIYHKEWAEIPIEVWHHWSLAMYK